MTDNTGPRLAGEGLCRNACRLKREVVRAVNVVESKVACVHAIEAYRGQLWYRSTYS